MATGRPWSAAARTHKRRTISSEPRRRLGAGPGGAALGAGAAAVASPGDRPGPRSRPLRVPWLARFQERPFLLSSLLSPIHETPAKPATSLSGHGWPKRWSAARCRFLLLCRHASPPDVLGAEGVSPGRARCPPVWAWDARPHSTGHRRRRAVAALRILRPRHGACLARAGSGAAGVGSFGGRCGGLSGWCAHDPLSKRSVATAMR